MKKYVLKKDMPFAKAGETFGLHRGGIEDCITLFKDNEEVYQFKVGENVSEMFDKWFEEIKEPELPKEFFCIDIDKVICYDYSYFSSNENTRQEYIRFMEKYKSVGNFFETREEAEKYLEYLKAKTIIKEDAKGFKPNWNDNSEIKYFGYLHFEKIEFGIVAKENKFGRERMNKTTTIYFQSEEDIKDSFEKHYKEWNTYLTYEQ
jgi:hypothetical protein